VQLEPQPEALFAIDASVSSVARPACYVEGMQERQQIRFMSCVFVAFVVVGGALSTAQQPVEQEAYVKPPNAQAGDKFGFAVAVYGDTLVVGAPAEGSDAQGVGGDPSNNSLPQSGAAYVYSRVGTSWQFEAYLKASNPGAFDGFGSAVAISGDTIVVAAIGEDSQATGVDGGEVDDSAEGAGAAYVFVRSAAGWQQQAYLKASNTDAWDRFGVSVGIDGDTIVVGAQTEGGGSAGVNGDDSDNSLAESGAAYVFVRTGNAWSQQAYLKAANPDVSDLFGISVSVSGDVVVVGASREDSGAVGVGGDPFDESASVSGAAYVFVRDQGVWTQDAYLKASNTGAMDLFGQSVDVSGDTIVVGAFGEGSGSAGVDGDQQDESLGTSGAAYVFVRDGQSWRQEAYLKAASPGLGHGFGFSVAVSGDAILVGVPSEDSGATGVNGGPADAVVYGAGAAYLLTRCGSTWRHHSYLKASNTGVSDSFGYVVDVDGDAAICGAWGESSGHSGVGANQDDDSSMFAGAVFAFRAQGPLATWCNYGEGYAGRNGVPALALEALPVLGGATAVLLGNASNFYTFGVLLVGASRGSLPTPLGGTLLAQDIFYVAGRIVPPAGASVTWSIPGSHVLLGTEIAAQWVHFDIAAGSYFAFSPGLQVVIGN